MERTWCSTQQKAQHSCWLYGSQTLSALGSDLVSASLSLCLSQGHLVLED